MTARGAHLEFGNAMKRNFLLLLLAVLVIDVHAREPISAPPNENRFGRAISAFPSMERREN